MFSPDSERNIVSLARDAAKNSGQSHALIGLRKCLANRTHSWVRAQRAALRLNQSEFGALLGVTRQTVASWENPAGTSPSKVESDTIEAFVLALASERKAVGT